MPRRIVWTALLLVVAYLLSGHGWEAASLYGNAVNRPAVRPVDPPVYAFAFAGRDLYAPVTSTVRVSTPHSFVSGSVDLTGDGVDEFVTVRGGRLQIHAGDHRVWESDPSWRTVDAALGDPNNDGRYEALVVFEKKDAVGRLRSQPFVVGYRRGLFGTWWGGSPVENPLREVELADSDGDGRQELLAIETLADGLTRVAVWRWHGWGFSLIWADEAGVFEGLSAMDVTGDGRPDIVVAANPSLALDPPGDSTYNPKP